MDVCVGMCVYACEWCARGHTQVAEHTGNEGGVFAFSVMKLKIVCLVFNILVPSSQGSIL